MGGSGSGRPYNGQPAQSQDCRSGAVVPRADLGRGIAGLARETGMAGHCRSMARGYAIRGGFARV